MKQAQITIFIVLGIVIMIIFGLFFFISKQTSGIVLEKRINKIYSDFLDSTNIEHIANDCLDKTTKEALLLVGLQGGRIYDYQIKGGYHIPSFYDVVPFNSTLNNLNGTLYNVSYGIKAPKSNKPYLNPPDYPYSGSLVSDVSKLWNGLEEDNPYDKLFSNVSARERKKTTILPDLCNQRGPNDPFTLGAGRSCETYSTKNESIQEYLQQYIEENVKDCINFTFTKREKYNLSAGDLTSIVLVGEDDLLISLTYPIEISIENKPPITKYLDFNIRPKIRLKILHEIAYHLIGYNQQGIGVTTADSSNIFFNIEKDDPNNCYKGREACIVDGIKVFKLRDYCLNNYSCNFDDRHYNYSDILVIEDDKSTIDGRLYRFQFAIENRRPAIDFIDESVGQDEYYYKYINETCKQVTICNKNLSELYNGPEYPISDSYNIVVEKGGILRIFPLGVDPDEDSLTYNYTIPIGTVLTNWDYLNPTDKKDVIITIGFEGQETLRINVSDNEGLYDYQDVVVNVIEP